MKSSILCHLNVSTLTKIYTFKELQELVKFVQKTLSINFYYFKAGNLDKVNGKFFPIEQLDWLKLNRKEIFKGGFSLFVDKNEEQRFRFSLWNRFDKEGNFINPFPSQGIGGVIMITRNIEESVINFIKKFIIKAQSSSGNLLECKLGEKIGNMHQEKEKGFYLNISNGAQFLTYIRPVFVPVLGKQNLLNAPAYKVEELENGGILIQSTKSIFDYHDGTQSEIDKKIEELEALDDYLLSLYPDNEVRLRILEEEENAIKNQHLTLEYLMNN